MTRNRGFDKVTEVRRRSRAAVGSVRPARVYDDHDSPDVCRYCRAEPCMCDEIYDAWRDRQMEKELDRE